MGYTIAKYIRLSIEDAKTKSLSIENQRLIIDRHIAGMDDSGATITEFIDNGYSGTDFERPAVQEMLESIRSGKVNCIVVKDFSRLGRDALETAYFLQRVFPLFRTRFIAVTDGYDSAEHEHDVGGLDVSLRLLLHEQYSRDLSAKIKAAKRMKAKNGEAIAKNCAFGFKKVGKRLEIDEPAAETVRIMFSMAADNKNLSEISERLYTEKRLPPSAYYKSDDNDSNNLSCIWCSPVIHSMLRDEQYAGTYVAGKSRKMEIGNKKTAGLPESEWVKIPGFHPAIVEPALFNKVQAVLNTKKEPIRRREITTSDRYSGIVRPLKGKVFCGCCNHRLRVSSTRNAVFSCQFTNAAPDAPCYKMRISESDLSSYVLDAICRSVKHLSDTGFKVSKRNQSESDFVDRISFAEQEKQKLYERLIRGEISADEFKSAKAPHDAELERLSASLAIYRDQQNKVTGGQKTDKQLREMCDAAQRDNALSPELVDTLIERVDVAPDGKINIVWLLPMLQAMQTEKNT